MIKRRNKKRVPEHYKFAMERLKDYSKVSTTYCKQPYVGLSTQEYYDRMSRNGLIKSDSSGLEHIDDPVTGRLVLLYDYKKKYGIVDN